MANQAAPGGNRDAQRRVGIWGATQSGKTTLLSSLFLAVARSSDQLRVRGNNDESTDFLIRNTHTLNQQRRFPSATQVATPLSWTLQMWVPGPPRGILRSGPDRVPFDFDIDMRDVAGADFAAIPSLAAPGPDRLDVLPGGGPDAGQPAAQRTSRTTSAPVKGCCC